MTRITDTVLASKVTTADHAATHIRPGDTVGMSGFTGAASAAMFPQSGKVTGMRSIPTPVIFEKLRV